jgi:N-dimethylarginine dimethylaminohydrolase
LRGRILLEVHVETVREQQGCALFDVRLQFLIQGLLSHVGNQHRHELRALDGGRRLLHFQTVFLGLVPAIALAYPDHYVETAVAQIERVRTTLAAITENGDARSAQGFFIDVFLRIQTHVVLPESSRK